MYFLGYKSSLDNYEFETFRGFKTFKDLCIAAVSLRDAALEYPETFGHIRMNVYSGSAIISDAVIHYCEKDKIYQFKEEC